MLGRMAATAVRRNVAVPKRVGILGQVSDEPQRTYTAREIVLEFFPATQEKLVPGREEYRLEQLAGGEVAVRQSLTGREVVLTPVARAGDDTTQVCCDLCQRAAPRHRFCVYRIALPHTQGRRFRYLSLCGDIDGCDARRITDEPLRRLLTRAFES